MAKGGMTVYIALLTYRPHARLEINIHGDVF